MKKILCILIILFVSGCVGLRPQETRIAVSTLLDEIQIAVNEINDKTAGSSLPKFHHAEITLLTEASKSGEGKGSFFLSAKGSYKKTESNSLVLVLEANDNKKKKAAGTSGEEIANYVIAAVSAIDEKEYLKLKTLTVNAGLAVVKEAGGAVSITLVGMSLEGGITASSKAGHQLKLVFGKPSKGK